ncbi:OVARIAN TUMOR DOMAIN-containing deubiquitinating enzyme 9-like isoform X2 [Malus sylvestris]|uniref:OVARIAN TUMOR DOMAIN-containing deubiquitinating enzyme 9-like isoform X2 n=1 Tax=Malus sylvestris TaxID=3752 RepID=UPI0021ABB1EA|nr:OVARIAN TUMOR DOMAIN-containing deubiquitinating enzyme 9-like isoform X2 [Malus sylvestris]
MLHKQMTTYNLDPDVVRWGLHLLDVCTMSNDNSHSTITQYDQDFSQVECVREGYVEPCNVENDEIIAQAYQEELSRLTSVEKSGGSGYGDGQLEASILAQDWLGPSNRHNGLENVRDAVNYFGRNMDTDDYRNKQHEAHDPRRIGNEVANDHCEGEYSINGEDFLHLLDITDESSLDGEVGRRLNQMASVPHIPKTNEKLPSEDEEISDHQRLLERSFPFFSFNRLQLYDLVECKVQGDGNCQFRALSDQLYRSPEYHGVVRDQIIQQLKSHPEMYEGYVPMGYADYLKKMSKNGEWGDHVTLQAAADSYGVKIFVITSFRDTCYIEILPHVEKSNRVICLSFWAEVHYNSIYPEGELPPPSLKKKKKWWKL